MLPDLDHSHLTGTLAATVAWEILSLIAAEWQRRRPEVGAAPDGGSAELGVDGPV